MKKILLMLTLSLLAFEGLYAQTEGERDVNGFTYKDAETEEVVRSAFLKRYRFWDNCFIGAQIGISHSMSENTRYGDFFNAEKPSVQIELGKWWYPTFGMRLTFGYKPQRGRANWELCDAYPEKYGFYSFDMAAVFLDGMINFTNIISPYRERRWLDVIAILGLGFNRTFSFDEDLIKTWEYYHVDTRHGNYFAAHGGLQFSFKLCPSLDLTVETTVNGTNDKYNGVVHDDVYDVYVDGMVGLRYHFKDHYGSRRFKYVRHDHQPIIERLNEIIGTEQEKLRSLEKPVVQKVEKVNIGEQLQTTITFYIDRYNITPSQERNVANVAKFLENHPEVNLAVTGYADVQTAYPEYNRRLSQKRAEAVYDMLVKKFKVDPKRLRLDYKGDAVQPYAEVNEWNRAVLFKMESPNSSNVYDIIASKETKKQEIVINDDVKTLNPADFQGRKDIRKITFGKNIKSIPDSCFQNCWGLEEVVFNEGLVLIGEKAFNGTLLQRVVLPSTLEGIGAEAFQNTSLVEVEIPSGKMPMLGRKVFSCDEKVIMRLIVPAAKVSAFKKDKEWGKFTNITNQASFWYDNKKK